MPTVDRRRESRLSSPLRSCHCGILPGEAGEGHKVRFYEREGKL